MDAESVSKSNLEELRARLKELYQDAERLMSDYKNRDLLKSKSANIDKRFTEYSNAHEIHVSTLRSEEDRRNVSKFFQCELREFQEFNVHVRDWFKKSDVDGHKSSTHNPKARSIISGKSSRRLCASSSSSTKRTEAIAIRELAHASIWQQVEKDAAKKREIDVKMAAEKMKLDAQIEAERLEREATENAKRLEREAIENAKRMEREATENAKRLEREAMENARKQEQEARMKAEKLKRDAEIRARQIEGDAQSVTKRLELQHVYESACIAANVWENASQGGEGMSLYENMSRSHSPNQIQEVNEIGMPVSKPSDVRPKLPASDLLSQSRVRVDNHVLNVRRPVLLLI
uniref:stress response protein NST1-like n=1 Tax=Styela clava TaxID=7725 RepID=UPI0019397AB5|nr:stress response protein NST1-like [Styela clava]